MGACVSRSTAVCPVTITSTKHVAWFGGETPNVVVGDDLLDTFEYVMGWGLAFFAQKLNAKEKQPGYENHEGPGREVVVFARNEGDAQMRRAYVTLANKAIEVLCSVKGGSELSKYGYEASSLRINKYTAQGSTCGAHTDTTLVTLICDSCSGLLLWNSQTQAWEPNPPRVITAFSGRFLYCLSNGVSEPPASHKVISSKPRISVAFFLRPNPSASLDIPRTDSTTTYNEILRNRAFPEPWEDILEGAAGYQKRMALQLK
eukprot:TRINITY_DN659_c2_g1_i2.p1 TRINITY_DN659_c2_g1~~TRINITY_DN659_c2_g1_i2.p1  ORF type:complete len:260 (+),score=26.32 TRINITY_DN659_c2_g1_i2:134-913(+)